MPSYIACDLKANTPYQLLIKDIVLGTLHSSGGYWEYYSKGCGAPED